MLTKVLLGLAVLALAAFLYLRVAGTISGQEARQLVEDGAVLVDVRTPEEFQAGHIEGARNIPVGELPQRSSEVGDKSQPVVVYCRSGARSRRAKGLLEDGGFTRVANLGPMSSW
jgi:rhodanese-related sulfurtransferase